MALAFPSSPSIGDEFTGGGFTWTWNGTSWSKISTASGGEAQLGFDLVIGTSGNTTFELAALQSAGEYTINSQLSDSTYDIYFINESNENVGYSTTGKITASEAFKKIVVYGGTDNDILNFSFGYVSEPSGDGNIEGGAAPFITAITPNNLPNDDDTMTITGGNFANNVEVLLIGQSGTEYAPKTTARSSANTIVVTRPNGLLASDGPYDVKVQNPGIPNPAQRANQLTNNMYVGSGVSWSTNAILPPFAPGQPFSTTLVASDPDASTLTYSVESGTLPSGLSLNSATGEISGTSNDTATVQVTIRATDAGGNFTDRQFTVAPNVSITGGTTVTGVDGYDYTTFTASTTMNVVRGGPVEVVTIAGGGGGGGNNNYGGGGAGGFLISSTTLDAGSYAIGIGSGGSGGNGTDTTIGSLTTLTAVGGGYGNRQNGGSGGGGMDAGGSGVSGQGNGGGNANAVRAVGYNAAGGGGGRGGGGGSAYRDFNNNGAVTGGGGGGGINYATWGNATNTGEVSGSNRYFAGGGGGRSGVGNAHGGNGAGHGVNTGGGGYWASSGDSGLVIIRYPSAS